MERDAIINVDIVNNCSFEPRLTPARTPFPSRHFFKSPTARNMESAGKRSAQELAWKRKANGSIVWKWFGYKVSDGLQNQVFCRFVFKSVATKG